MWYRSGHRLISSNKYKIEDDGTKLTINDVNRDDLGSYICIVSDKNNHASTSASLSSLNGKLSYFILCLSLLSVCYFVPFTSLLLKKYDTV